MSKFRPERVDIRTVDRMHDGFVKLDVMTLSHMRYDGTMSPDVQREIVVRKPAAALLPYDPHSDRIVMIEQFRPPPYVIGANAWLNEVIAGLIDEGETAESAIRREAMEEAGLTVGRIAPIGAFFSSPGVCTETVQCFCGEVTSPETDYFSGSRDENEDIRVYSVTADSFIEQALNGTLNNATALVCGLWFAAKRARKEDIWTSGGQ